MNEQIPGAGAAGERWSGCRWLQREAQKCVASRGLEWSRELHGRRLRPDTAKSKSFGKHVGRKTGGEDRL